VTGVQVVSSNHGPGDVVQVNDEAETHSGWKLTLEAGLAPLQHWNRAEGAVVAGNYHVATPHDSIAASDSSHPVTIARPPRSRCSHQPEHSNPSTIHSPSAFFYCLGSRLYPCETGSSVVRHKRASMLQFKTS